MSESDLGWVFKFDGAPNALGVIKYEREGTRKVDFSLSRRLPQEMCHSSSPKGRIFFYIIGMWTHAHGHS